MASVSLQIPGPCLNIKTMFPRYEDSHVKDKTSWDRVIFNMGILILVRQQLYIETAPRSLSDHGPKKSIMWRCYLWWSMPQLKFGASLSCLVLYSDDVNIISLLVPGPGPNFLNFYQFGVLHRWQFVTVESVAANDSTNHNCFSG